MPARKQCQKCQTMLLEGHWAFSRDACPSCGGTLRPMTEAELGPLKYEHYDSSADIQFDFSGLLTPAQRKETWVLFSLGLSLIVLAFVARLLFVLLAGLEGFWRVPLWFDVLVVIMVLLGAGMAVWAIRRLWLHRRATRRHTA